jgi:hypothetical protein
MPTMKKAAKGLEKRVTAKKPSMVHWTRISGWTLFGRELQLLPWLGS